MTTGQYPIRRETDEQAAKRVAELDQRRAEHEAGATPLDWRIVRFLRPKLAARGLIRR